MQIVKIAPKDYEYSKNLEFIPQSPERLFVAGDLPKSRIKTVAIVGARKPTAYGREVAEKLATDLARAGVVVVSGLAYGIDACAHRGALDGGGVTIAVLAGGLDKIYPASNRGLADRIVQNGGALISEYPEGVPAMKHQFLERNRIVSGLADVVIVVEAAERSGTLSTANHALEQGKDVFAVPGNITSPLSAGCNRLIKMGATPLLSVQDILEVLNIGDDSSRTAQTSLISGDNDEENKILEIIASGERDGAQILEKSGLEVSVYNRTMTMLEIKGLIKALGANKWGLG